jgi:nucleotide-binding universal stress UspA family protein
VNGEGANEEDVGLSGVELIDLLARGVQPMLIVRRKRHSLSRVLLVYDGSPAAGRAIRSALSQSLYPKAEYRLLAVGPSEVQARESLAEMTDYCSAYRIDLETGCVCGSLRRVLIPYARKWQADLLVMGVTRGNRVLRSVFGEVAQDVLNKSPCALYAVA